MLEKYKQTDKYIDREKAGFLEAPELICSPYPFVAIGDLEEMAGRLVPGMNGGLNIGPLQQELLSIQRSYAPEISSFYYVDQGTLIQRTEALIGQKFSEELSRGNNVGIINFDRYLLADVNAENLFKLNLSRSPDGSLTSRPGSKLGKDVQLDNLAKWLKRGQYSSIILTDDVVAFADTFQQIATVIKDDDPDRKLSVVCGICSSRGIWSGKEKLNRLGVEVASVITSVASPAIENGSSGMAIPDSRDFTILGGKVKTSPTGRTLSFPYFYPFSKPLASFYAQGKEFEASRELLAFNKRLVARLEKMMKKELRVGDLESLGFGVPYTSIPEMQAQLAIPEPSMLVRDLLLQAESL